MIRYQVGQRIKELRLSAGMSQERFALEVGLDRTYIASVEHGRRNISICESRENMAGTCNHRERIF